MQIEIIGALFAIIAILVTVKARMMAAVNTGITVPSNVVYMGGGDPGYIYLTASEGIGAGDNVVAASASTVELCDANDDEYLGTADKYDDAVLDGNNPMTHDAATGEVVRIITGNCHVRKIADAGNVNKGFIQRIGTGDGVECVDIGTAANKFTIGRALASATSGNAFPMHQF